MRRMLHMHIRDRQLMTARRLDTTMLIPTYLRKNRFILYSTVYAHKQIGDKSAAGRGGMAAKIGAATRAVQGGVTSVVIANGIHPYTIEQVNMRLFR